MSMKVLLIHSDFIEWEAKKRAIKDAEETGKGPVRIKEALVAFSAVEKSDEGKEESVARSLVEEIAKTKELVKASSVVLYPFVHLSQEPARPSSARKVLDLAEESLKRSDVPVSRAPFGWYKAFDLKCKGHPLAELSRDIRPGGKKDVSEALKKEETMESHWHVLEPNGKLHPLKMESGKPRGFDFKGHDNLAKFASYEMAKSRQVKEQPPHIQIMQKQELVDYEPGSDPGNLRFMPKGRMIKALMEEWTTRNVLEYGGMEVETPIMYDYEHPSLKKYLNRFPARQYTIETPNKRVFLRFAACFGQFLMAHDANISYRNLPLRMYEMTRYSFRVEQHGELAGLRRLRSFTMPDCHALVKDFEQAKDEMLKRMDVARRTVEGMGLSLKDDLEVGLRVVKEFYEEHKPFVHDLVKRIGKPVLVEMWDKRFFYFVLKYE